MASASAIYHRHIKTFAESNPMWNGMSDRIIIYAAAMVCEAIRNEQEDVDLRVIEPNGGKRPA